uniref:Uncharacterized protein n=1 Tax=Podospora anserina (strain S / ATCC MYA-4624 / DSM 980 / FGSC 10383) TaxID=515849 RepID=A0A090C962_PODAN|nr:Putative protein of unknown function [Podospora anserina S mat+]
MISRPGIRHNVIANSMLASSFETYRLLSKPLTRGASYIPGPLESQWRLGRRRMGFSLQCPPTPPPWAFMAPLDLSKWRWDPPKSLADIVASDLTHEPGTSLSFLARSIKASLGLGASSTQHVVDDSASALSVEQPPPKVRRSNQVSMFLADVELFRTAAAEVDEHMIMPLTEEISNKLYWYILQGDLAPVGLARVADHLYTALDSRLRATSTKATTELDEKADEAYNSQLLLITTTIIRALSNSRVYPLSSLGARFWDALGERLAMLPACDETCNLLAPFVSLLCDLPHISLTVGVQESRFERQLLRLLNKHFVLWACTSSRTEAAQDDALDWLSPKTSQMRQARALGAALDVLLNHIGGLNDTGRYDRHHLLSKINDTVKRVLVRSSSLAEKCGLRYAWLTTLAHARTIGEPNFVQTARLFTKEEPSLPPLSGAELGWLLLAQWNSRQMVRSDQLVGIYNYYYRERRQIQDDAAALTSFLKAVYHHNILYTSPDLAVQTYAINAVPKWEREEWGITPLALFHAYGRTVWRLLDALGRVGDVLVSLEAYICPRNGGMVGKNFLEILAESSGMRHEVRIDIAELFNFELRHPDAYEFNPCSIEHVAEKIIKDEKLPPDTIWRCLGLYNWVGGMLGFSGGYAKDRSCYSPRLYKMAQYRIITNAATWFAERPDLSYSQKYRHVYLCILFLKRRGKKTLPASALKALYDVAVEDLKAGRWGRTRLLLHFCRLVGEIQGPEAERECRLAFSLWRQRLARLQKLKGIEEHFLQAEGIEELETVVEKTEKLLREKHVGTHVLDDDIVEAQETQRETGCHDQYAEDDKNREWWPRGMNPNW